MLLRHDEHVIDGENRLHQIVLLLGEVLRRSVDCELIIRETDPTPMQYG